MSEALTDEEIAAIEARAEAATPGPWRANSYSTIFADHKLSAYREAKTDAECYEADPEVASVPAFAGDMASPRRMADAAHIAGMDPPTTLRLCAALRAERARADKYVEAFRREERRADAAERDRDDALGCDP